MRLPTLKIDSIHNYTCQLGTLYTNIPEHTEAFFFDVETHSEISGSVSKRKQLMKLIISPPPSRRTQQRKIGKDFWWKFIFRVNRIFNGIYGLLCSAFKV